AVSATLAAALSLAPALPLLAQQRAVTAADYARAERAMSYNVNPLVYGTTVRPTWLPDDRVWFRDATPTGTQIILVDPAKATRTRCDNEPSHCGIDFPPDTTGGRGARGGLAGRGGGGRGGRGGRPPETMSPDGTKGAFIRDWNLWVRDVATGRETQL